LDEFGASLRVVEEFQGLVGSGLFRKFLVSTSTFAYDPAQNIH
jgi:hypothetical protein